MKKIYLSASLCFFTAVNAQIISIPDTNFKAKLLEADASNTIAKDLSNNYFKIDSNGDGEIQETEALEVSFLDVNKSSISSLEGIKKFNNIQTISCEENQLTSLDLGGLVNLIFLNCYYNSLTSLNFSESLKLESLNCGKNQLSSMEVEGFMFLKDLFCGYNQISSLNVRNTPQLINLFCGNNKLTSLNTSDFLSVAGLDCSFNQIETLDVGVLNNLQMLYCSFNKISALNVSNLINIRKIYCDSNLLTGSLDLSKLINLDELICYNNQLTVLNVSGLSKLKRLECGNNQLSSLDLAASTTTLENLRFNGNPMVNFGFDLSIMVNLISLDCSYSGIVNPDFSTLKKIKYLFCGGVNLTNLDLTGMNDLEFLECSNNLITNLDVSNLIGLHVLSCNSNEMATLKLDGSNNITGIECRNNKISTLDLSHLKNLAGLNSSDNPSLESVYLKNGSMETDLFLTNTPNLKYVCVDEGQIATVQGLISQNGYKDCVVNSYCSFTPGGDFYTISGNNRIDSDNNGCDASDLPAANVKFVITDGTTTGTVISNESGNYSINVQEGTYSITPIIENSDYFTVFPTSVNVSFPNTSNSLTQDFCFTPVASHKDLEITLIPLEAARPGFDAKYKLTYRNKGNVEQSGVVNLTFNDTVLDLIVSNPVVTIQNTNSLSWNFSDLKPFETREIAFTLNVNGPMEIPAVNNDDVLYYTATINSSDIDESPEDNSFVFNHSVVGSFDPNDKTCLEGDIIKPELIGEYVHYLIRFENTGNYPAQNIVVKDIIDQSKFDISTLVPTDASHKYITKISEGNKVEFVFENINLPFDNDSNDGFIAFKIKTKSTLAVGDSFENKADIYFDYNFPIETNTAKTTYKTVLGTADFDFSKYVNVYPIPATSVLNISQKKNINIHSMAVYNVLGQAVIQIPNADKTQFIDVSKLGTGNYFIKIISDKGTSSTKFIKI